MNVLWTVFFLILVAAAVYATVRSNRARQSLWQIERPVLWSDYTGNALDRLDVVERNRREAWVDHDRPGSDPASLIASAKDNGGEDQTATLLAIDIRDLVAFGKRPDVEATLEALIDLKLRFGLNDSPKTRAFHICDQVPKAVSQGLELRAMSSLGLSDAKDGAAIDPEAARALMQEYKWSIAVLKRILAAAEHAAPQPDLRIERLKAIRIVRGQIGREDFADIRDTLANERHEQVIGVAAKVGLKYADDAFYEGSLSLDTIAALRRSIEAARTHFPTLPDNVAALDAFLADPR